MEGGGGGEGREIEERGGEREGERRERGRAFVLLPMMQWEYVGCGHVRCGCGHFIQCVLLEMDVWVWLCRVGVCQWILYVHLQVPWSLCVYVCVVSVCVALLRWWEGQWNLLLKEDKSYLKAFQEEAVFKKNPSDDIMWWIHYCLIDYNYNLPLSLPLPPSLPLLPLSPSSLPSSSTL